MTSVYMQEINCAMCGSKKKQSFLGSSNTFGYMDLDTRPAEMMRYTMGFWISRCPACGYCAGDISKSIPGATTVMATPAYQHYLTGMLPQLAGTFLCYSLLCRGAGKTAEAGWAALHAAWACDDKPNTDGAITSRKLAAELFQQAQEEGIAFMKSPAAEIVMLADILRRAGDFKAVTLLCQNGLPPDSDPFHVKLLALQSRLTAIGDTSCHTVEDVK